MLSSDFTAPAVPSAAHDGLASVRGLAGGACLIAGDPTVVRARRAVAATAAAVMAKATNDVWGSRAWSPPV